MNQRNTLHRHGRTVIGALLLAALLAGCTGPSTRVLSRQGDGQGLSVHEDMPVPEGVSAIDIQEELANLTTAPRPSGSRQESDTAKNMQERLLEYGYQATRQRFRYELQDGVVSGSNVVAIRDGSSPDSDILIICSHHDTVESSVGANDNASGVVVLLETARLLSKAHTDTEIRLISFAGHEQELLGSRHYAESLSRREKERIIGVIDLDQLGYVSCGEVTLGTIDGKGTMLGDLLRDVSEAVLDETWNYSVVYGGDASSFRRNRIPAVTLTQTARAYENGTPFDQAATIDGDRISRLVEVVCQAALQIMNPDTPSMAAKAHAQNDLRQDIYVQGEDTPIFFGADLEKTASQIGLDGRLVAESVDEEENPTQTYRFSMKWFGFDVVMPTDYRFVNGRLSEVELNADNVAVSFEEMKERMSERYGDSMGQDAGPSGTEYSWLDSVHRRQVQVWQTEDGFHARLTACDPGKTVLELRNLDGTRIGGSSGDSRVEPALALIQTLFPDNDTGLIRQITFYTDGVGGSLGEALPAVLEHVSVDADTEAKEAEEDRSESEPGLQSGGWELWFDLDDALDEDGNFRDKVSTVELLVDLYGRMLDGTYQESFEDRFVTDAEETGFTAGEKNSDVDGSESERLESEEADFVSDESESDAALTDETAPADWSIPEWKSQSDIRTLPEDEEAQTIEAPDFTDSFRMFVLAANRESGMAEWDSRIGFFYEFDELTAYRSQVRKGLGLSVDDSVWERPEGEEE
ncbi:MAG: M28 family peptidase [Clostridiales bacterium]|nr:M28 family peptidase [Clostridiales bacterium]